MDNDTPQPVISEEEFLKRKHRDLDHKIIVEQRARCPDEAKITAWKAEKLVTRDQLAAMGVETQATAEFGIRPPKRVTRKERAARRTGEKWCGGEEYPPLE